MYIYVYMYIYMYFKYIYVFQLNKRFNYKELERLTIQNEKI